MNEKKFPEQKNEIKKEETCVKVTWKDNGQIIMEFVCYPEEVQKINEIFDFINKLDI